ILRYPRTAAYEAVRSDVHELVHRDEAGDYRVVLHGHVTGELRTVRDDDPVAQMAVVREMHVRHDEAVGAHGGAHRLGGAAVDRGILADHAAVADLHRRVLTAELEVLRIAADDGADPDLHLAAQTHVALERGA